MKKKKKVISKNYLENIPLRHYDVDWKTEKDGKITLEIENKGWANRIAQKLFGRPKVSYVHLDEMGSFLWPKLNGEKTITQLGEEVKQHFGDKAEPLYERLATYFKILESYRFITFKER